MPRGGADVPKEAGPRYRDCHASVGERRRGRAASLLGLSSTTNVIGDRPLDRANPALAIPGPVGSSDGAQPGGDLTHYVGNSAELLLDACSPKRHDSMGTFSP